MVVVVPPRARRRWVFPRCAVFKLSDKTFALHDNHKVHRVAGNLLWDKLGNPETVWAVDWQVPTKGPAILDVAWFLGIGIPVTDVKIVRQEILPGYHRALVGGGVTGYTYSQFLDDYKYGLLNALQHMIGVLAVVDLARDDSLDLVRLVVGNVAAAADDAGCEDADP